MTPSLRPAYDDLATIEEMLADAGRTGDTLGVTSPLDRAMLAATGGTRRRGGRASMTKGPR